MALAPPPTLVDSVIIGNGPSALIVSYILHGHIPYYNPSNPHPDPILHSRLVTSPCLLNIDVHNLTEHFQASRISYSTQALPINVLLDTLIRPLADTEPGAFKTCVEWRYEPGRAVEHVVLGNTAEAGGQWANNPVSASWDIGTLSYAEMLSLPGYSLSDHYKISGRAQPADFYRPTRREIASYLAAYPEAVGISDSFRFKSEAEGITRTASGFHIASHNLHCSHLILASGIFSHLLPARPQLEPLLRLPKHSTECTPPLLVVGSGFTAADIIISALSNRKIIHIYKWNPDDHPSPLRACHADAYPDYAGVYRRMKLSAMTYLGQECIFSPLRRRKSNPFFRSRDWDQSYEGLPNTYIKDVSIHGDYARVTLQGADGRVFERDIANLEYVIGRRGSLEYLDMSLQNEVLSSGLPTSDNARTISGQSLRLKVERNLQVAPEIFVIGSLTGDSLVRFAFGGCVFAAQKILLGTSASPREPKSMGIARPHDVLDDQTNRYRLADGHTDLGISRKARSASVDIELFKSDIWRNSGWWSGTCPAL
ncbi:hypothetical protein MMC34_006242 [Xylographa carneopallida]|nr:hypothetical protein [Xylographa carneopallida]